MATITAIITVFNREAYLREALQSVFEQTRPADEIIVIDDGSTDRSAEVARSFGPRVQCISQANQGIGGARNTGVAAAQGDLIAFLDSDDLWLEKKLEAQHSFLDTHPNSDLVFCRMKPFLSPEINPESIPAFDDREIAACICSAALVYRRIFQLTGGFETDLQIGEFISWFDRAQEKGLRYDTLPDLLLRRRVHLGNSVHNHEAKSDYLHILKRRIDRSRAAGQAEV
jgi:glycosyltransferase involved in cell wall biosynthesis